MTYLVFEVIILVDQVHPSRETMLIPHGSLGALIAAHLPASVKRSSSEAGPYKGHRLPLSMKEKWDKRGTLAICSM